MMHFLLAGVAWSVLDPAGRPESIEHGGMGLNLRPWDLGPPNYAWSLIMNHPVRKCQEHVFGGLGYRSLDPSTCFVPMNLAPCLGSLRQLLLEISLQVHGSREELKSLCEKFALRGDGLINRRHGHPVNALSSAQSRLEPKWLRS